MLTSLDRLGVCARARDAPQPDLELRRKIQPSAGQFGALKFFLELRSAIWAARFFYGATQRDLARQIFFGATQRNLAGQIFLRSSAREFGASKISAEVRKAFWHAIGK